MAVGKLEYRSIQIGIRPELSEVWAKEWVEGIEVSAPTPGGEVADRDRMLRSGRKR